MLRIEPQTATPPWHSWQQIVESNQPTQAWSQMFPSCCTGSLPLSVAVLRALLINCGRFNTPWHFVTYGFGNLTPLLATVKLLIWCARPPNVTGSLRLKQMVLNFVMLCPNHLPALGPGVKVLMVRYFCWREYLYFVTYWNGKYQSRGCVIFFEMKAFVCIKLPLELDTSVKAKHCDVRGNQRSLRRQSPSLKALAEIIAQTQM